jgi:hypothetical protein
LFAGAFVLSHRRKPERTGNSIMFNPVKNVLVFIVSVIGMVILSVLFWATTDSVAMFYIGMAVGFAIGYVIAQMIAEKSLMIGEKLKYFPAFGGIAVGLVITIFLFTQFGMGFFVNRIPETSEIYGVRVGEWLSYLGHLDVEEKRDAFITDPARIEEVRAAHLIMVNGRDELQITPNFNTHGSWNYSDGIVTTTEVVRVEYLLHNGRTVSRMYNLPCSFVFDTGIYTFLDEIVHLSRYEFFTAPEYIVRLDVHFGELQFVERFGWWENRGSYDVHIPIIAYDEIVHVLELFSQALVQEARTERELRRQNIPSWWTPFPENPEDATSQRSVRLSPHFDWDNAPRRIRSWSHPSIQGDFAEKLLLLMYEWGHVDADVIERVFE